MQPQYVVEEVKRRSRDRRSALSFFWITCRDRRDEFAQGVWEKGSDLPLCPVVVRTRGFVDPNAVAFDLLQILERVRSDLLRPDLAKRVRAANCLDFVLIARRELELASSSSPLMLPKWFPIYSSAVVTATITDLTWATHVSLRVEELQTGEIARLLFELDRELVRKLRSVHARDHRLVNSLHHHLTSRSEGAKSFADLLAAAESSLDRVTNPRGFRPSTVRHPTLVGRFWRIANTTPADNLQRVAKSVVTALDLPTRNAPGVDESIMTVLGRPSSPIVDVWHRWGFNLVLTIRSACQLITAAAHADEYAMYPLPLVRSVSRDIRISLDQSVAMLTSGRLTHGED